MHGREWLRAMGVILCATACVDTATAPPRDDTGGFRATGHAGAPDSLAEGPGNGQWGMENTPLPDSVGVTVLDKHGNPVPGATVHWTVTRGGGRMSPDSSRTGPTGVAFTAWTLGPWAPDSVEAAQATVGALPPLSLTAYVAPPPLEVAISPPNGTVALDGFLDVEATCDRRCSRLAIRLSRIGRDGQFSTVAEVTDRDTVRTRLDLRTGIDPAVEVVAERSSTDSWISVMRSYWPEQSPSWQPVLSAGEELYDFDATRALYLSYPGQRWNGGWTLNVADRASGAALALAHTGVYGLGPGDLHVRGALYDTQDPLHGRVNAFDWRGGDAVLAGPYCTRDRITPDGRFATLICNHQATMGELVTYTLRVRDLDAGVTWTVANEADAHAPQLVDNGDVVFANGDAMRFRAGTLTRLTTGGGVLRAASDGVAFAYVRQLPTRVQALLVTDGDTVELTPAVGVPDLPGLTMSHGWVVYSRPDAGGTLQLWSRSPDGTVRPVTTNGFGAVASLGPAGQVVYTDPANTRRYVKAPPYTAPAADAGGLAAILRWKGSDLYAFYGRTAFRVNF